MLATWEAETGRSWVLVIFKETRPNPKYLLTLMLQPLYVALKKIVTIVCVRVMWLVRLAAHLLHSSKDSLHFVAMAALAQTPLACVPSAGIQSNTCSYLRGVKWSLDFNSSVTLATTHSAQQLHVSSRHSITSITSQNANEQYILGDKKGDGCHIKDHSRGVRRSYSLMCAHFV